MRTSTLQTLEIPSNSRLFAFMNRVSINLLIVFFGYYSCEMFITHLIIPKESYVCDQAKDCDDGSDEENCGAPEAEGCSEGYVACKNHPFICIYGKIYSWILFLINYCTYLLF